MLDPAVRERHAVLALDVAGLVPGPALAEVCVVIVVMDPVGEVEGVGLVTLLMVTTVTSVASVTNEPSDTIRLGEAGGEASEDGETSDGEGLGWELRRWGLNQCSFDLSILTIMLVVCAHKCKWMTVPISHPPLYVGPMSKWPSSHLEIIN